MNRRRLVVLLVLLGLLAGGVAHVPVARAVVYYDIVPVAFVMVGVTANYVQISFSTVTDPPIGHGHSSGTDVMLKIDGTYLYQTWDDGYGMYPTAFFDSGPVPCGLAARWTNAAVRAMVNDGQYHTVSWVTFTDTPYGTALGFNAGSFQMKLIPCATWSTVPLAPPVSVSLSGAFTTQIGVPYTATATASEGYPPYRYLFSIDWVTVIGGVNQYDNVYTGSLTSSGTFTYTFTFTGEFLIRVTALDSTDAEATDTLDLNAGVNKPALWGQIYDIPGDDALKTYIEFALFPANVASESPTPPGNGGIQTQFYEITSPGTVEKGSVYYMLYPILITALPNPLVIYINYHDPVSGADWSYMFSFDTTGWTANSGAASNGDSWTGAETPGAFAWLWDMLIDLFRFLFVPNATDFSKQIASGWVLITSPVPTITPQYTIPFPNPDHMLAPTGDSVNIDFSAISTWTYHATVKALVQVFLYAILVFVVIGIVT